MAPSLRQRNQQNGKREFRKSGGRRISALSRNEEPPTNPNPADMGIVYPSGDTAFKALLSARFCAAIWSHISDCDETYNYWEPSHYLLFGKGFQTWEYSPEYALRSYTYLMLHVVPAWLYHHLLQPNRILIFYFSRCLFGLLCAFCEVYFYKSVCREFGVQVGRLTLAFQVFSAGMFISSTAFLPSTFSMYMCLLSMGAWYQRKYELAVFTTALSAFLSWPFAALLGVPIALDMLLRRKEIKLFLQWSAISTLVILLPMVKLDSTYFGRLVVAPYNIIHYNVFTSHGPDLYGTEPFHFYFINAFLNFNFVFIGALLAPLMLTAVTWLVPSKPRNPGCLPYWLSLMPLYLWMAVFFIQPHKEERFLFPVYPLICLCGAISVDAAQKLWFRFFVTDVERGTHYLSHTTPIMISAIIVCGLLSVSRIFAVYIGFIKVTEILLGTAGAICISLALFNTSRVALFFLATSISGIWLSFVFLAVHQFKLTEKINKAIFLKVELGVCILWTVAYIIAGSLANSYSHFDVAYSIAAFFGFSSYIVYGYDAFLKFTNLFPKRYHAPVDLFMELNNLTMDNKLPADQTINVCVGKEWYRYPSSFFLPDNRWQLQFLKSEFRGQLPQPFNTAENGTSVIPPNMNDLNKEEPSRYAILCYITFLEVPDRVVAKTLDEKYSFYGPAINGQNLHFTGLVLAMKFEIERCHFLVDLDLGTSSGLEPNYSKQNERWAVYKTVPFLDASRSHPFFRAFYIPSLSDKFCTYAPFNLLRSKKFKWGKPL